MLLYGALSHVFPISYVISCKNDATLPFRVAIMMAQNGNNFFLGGKPTDMLEKKVENIIVHVLKCK